MTSSQPKASKNCDLRRQEARRQRGEASGTIWQRVFSAINPRVFLIWCAFYVAVVAILLSGRESMQWHLGQMVDRDFTARVSYPVEVKLQTDDNRKTARAAVPAFYVPNDKPLSDIQDALREWEKPTITGSTPGAVKQDTREVALNDATRQALHKYLDENKTPGTWDAVVKQLTVRLKNERLVDAVGEGDKHEFRRGEIAVQIPRDKVIIADADSVAQVAKESSTAVFPESLAPAVAEVIVHKLNGSQDKKMSFVPLWRYDVATTVEARRQAEDQVPPVIREIKKGDTLVTAGEQLTVEDLDLLKREHAGFLQAQHNDRSLYHQLLLHQIGIAAIAFMVTIGLGGYSSLYEPRLFRKPPRAIGLCALLLIMTGLSRLIEMAEWPYDLPVEISVGVVTMAAAIMTIAFSQRFAFGGSGALCVLATLASRGDFNLSLTLLTASGICVFLLRDIRSRSKVVGVGFVAGVGAAFTSAATHFISGEHFQYAMPHAAAAGLAAVVAGLVVQGILPQFERLFGIVTSMTLLEWCDASRPLLRLLAQNAPGTYSHSLILSQMAEEAAESIGARGLLARVGALYHDIGKAAKAEYFVENQEARINRHDKLSPTMSLLIIVGHVKDGLEMARAYGLPRILNQFIQEHHGTTLVRYFHRAAVDAEASAKNKRFCDRDVPESEFRYPGPKPSSKESAILMLCDGTEGAVRALGEPTPGRIEGVVHQVVMDRLNDGQFDDCDITLRELRLVERSLVKSLGAIHHGRIRYPDKPTPTTVRNGESLSAEDESDQDEEVSTPAPQQPVEMVRQA